METNYFYILFCRYLINAYKTCKKIKWKAGCGHYTVWAIWVKGLAQEPKSSNLTFNLKLYK